MQFIDLTGKWQFRGDDADGVVPRSVRNVTRWMPATVPGTVHTDLMALEKIPDPFHRMQELDVQWVERGRVDLSHDVPRSALASGRRATSISSQKGLIRSRRSRINGTQVGSARNMFIAHRFDIRKAIVAGTNDIEIAFASPEVSAKALESEHGKLQVALETYRVYTRKAQYSFGWDWGPKLTTSGIWRPIRIEAYSGRAAQASRGPCCKHRSGCGAAGGKRRVWKDWTDRRQSSRSGSPGTEKKY